MKLLNDGERKEIQAFLSLKIEEAKKTGKEGKPLIFLKGELLELAAKLSKQRQDGHTRSVAMLSNRLHRQLLWVVPSSKPGVTDNEICSVVAECFEPAMKKIAKRFKTILRANHKDTRPLKAEIKFLQQKIKGLEVEKRGFLEELRTLRKVREAVESYQKVIK